MRAGESDIDLFDFTFAIASASETLFLIDSTVASRLTTTPF